MSKAVIIVAGGTGSRMKSELPKQFMLIHGKPVIIHTIEKFLQWDNDLQVIVVVHNDFVDHWVELKKKHFAEHDISHCTGGVTRFHSVRNGLELVSGASYIAIHDAARPLVSVKLIEQGFHMLKENSAVIPVITVYESMRKISGECSNIVDRNEYVLVQTPQFFETSLLHRAYKQGYSDRFTDDASVVEDFGSKIKMIAGNRENIKITEPSDLRIAAGLL